jgi:hypothetical protein
VFLAFSEKQKISTRESGSAAGMFRKKKEAGHFYPTSNYNQTP